VQLADDPARADSLVRTEGVVQASSSLPVRMSAGGGFVAMFTPLNETCGATDNSVGDWH